MPYKSKAQQGFFHSPKAKAAGISEQTVADFDAASKGVKDLPDKVPAKPKPKTGLDKLKEKIQKAGY